MTDLVIGKGRLYFEPFVAGTLRRTGAGFAYFGNTPELTVSKEVEKQEHFSSEGGLNVKDASVVTQETTSGGFTTDHISNDNLALWYGGEKQNVTQAAGVDATDSWESVVLGNYFQLGEIDGQVQGARNVSNVTATKGDEIADGTITLSTAPPVEGDELEIDGVAYTFRADPIGDNDVQIGGTLAAAATNLANAINADAASRNVTAAAVGAVVTITAAYAGTIGNAITMVKDVATAGNVTLSGATLAGGTDTAVAAEGNFTVNAATGMVRVLPDAPDINNGDSLTFTYDQAATGLTVVVAGSRVIEGRMLFVADNPYGENKDHLWPRVQLSSDGDYSLIGDDWQAITFAYEVLKLDDDTPREIITNRG